MSNEELLELLNERLSKSSKKVYTSTSYDGDAYQPGFSTSLDSSIDPDIYAHGIEDDEHIEPEEYVQVDIIELDSLMYILKDMLS